MCDYVVVGWDLLFVFMIYELFRFRWLGFGCCFAVLVVGVGCIDDFTYFGFGFRGVSLAGFVCFLLGWI